jgi:hypothetical protein
VFFDFDVSVGDHSFDIPWLCTLQGTLLQLDVTVFLLTAFFVNNSYLQICRGQSSTHTSAAIDLNVAERCA